MKIKINKSKKNLWSGRFKENPSDSMIELNASIKFDKKLFESDIYNLKKYNKEYKKFDIQIECNSIDLKKNNIDFINYLYARSIRKY